MLRTMPIARQRIATPIGFLAEQEQLRFQWPANAELSAWQSTAKIVKKKMAVTIRFTTERRSRLKADSELYFVLGEAQQLAMTAHTLAVNIQMRGRFMRHNNFLSKTAELKAQCDNLKGSIKRIFSLLDEDALSNRVDRAM
jgi:hypothetical protein